MRSDIAKMKLELEQRNENSNLLVISNAVVLLPADILCLTGCLFNLGTVQG